jgi:hypothetical protein
MARRGVVRSLLGFVVIMLLSVGGLVGVGLGLGVLLHALVPAIDIGVGTLIGVVAFGFGLQFVGRLLFFSDLSLEEEEEPPPASWTIPPRVEPHRGRQQRRRKRS